MRRMLAQLYAGGAEFLSNFGDKFPKSRTGRGISLSWEWSLHCHSWQFQHAWARDPRL